MRIASRTTITAAIFVGLLAPHTANGYTVRVEQDGSGDYLLIQDAVDAAASGDTILIGPGRYDDLQPRGVNSVVSVAYWEDERDLTFIGEDVNAVVIGPTSYAPAGTGPQGIHQHEPADIRIEGVSFENLRFSVVAGRGTVSVIGTRFYTGEFGVLVQAADTIMVRSCSFEEFDNSSVSIGGADYAEVVDCDLSNASIYFGSVQDGAIRRCNVVGGALVYCYRSSCLIEKCSAQCSGFRQCIALSECYTIDIYDCLIAGGTSNVAATGGDAQIEALRSSFTDPTEYANFDFGFEASLVAHDNHIRLGGGLDHVVLTSWYPSGNTATIDLGSNYWFDAGTPSQLDSLIYDGNDDPSLHIIVNYNPIRTEPVPTEKNSFGGLKAMYR